MKSKIAYTVMAIYVILFTVLLFSCNNSEPPDEPILHVTMVTDSMIWKEGELMSYYSYPIPAGNKLESICQTK